MYFARTENQSRLILLYRMYPRCIEVGHCFLACLALRTPSPTELSAVKFCCFYRPDNIQRAPASCVSELRRMVFTPHFPACVLTRSDSRASSFWKYSFRRAWVNFTQRTTELRDGQHYHIFRALRCKTWDSGDDSRSDKMPTPEFSGEMNSSVHGPEPPTLKGDYLRRLKLQKCCLLK